MKILAAVAMTLGLFVAPTSWADPAAADPTAAAQAAAVRWLALSDAARHGDAWELSAAYFRNSITKAAWEAAAKAAREPLGAVKSRTLKSATVKTALPGVPDGEYVVIRYDTRFENKAAAVETITPMKEKDGTWKVSGYFIH